jgi:TonB family protein
LKGLLHLSFVPLTQAVSSGDANAVNSSLASGADVNERTAGGQTALILATIFGHTHLIPVLLKAGADPQLRDNLGLNALDWAQRRGSAEAFDVLTGKSKSNSETRVESRSVSTKREEHSEATEKTKPSSEADKSRRWLAGLQQRIAEQGGPRNLPDGQNIFRQQVQPATEPPPIPEPEPEIQAVPEVTELALPEEPAQPPPVEEEPAQQSQPKSSGRKRCPKCNAIYHSPLVAYCAHHIVPLVDADDAPIISEPAKASPVMFWMIIIITLSGSIVIASLISSYVYKSKPAASASAAQPTPNPVQKGVPAVGRELTGRVVSLPVAECPLNGQEAIPGTVVVKVEVDKNGKVKNARASGGDWLLRDAATAAAMKSTFSPEKLRNREIEGTITYTFEP